MATIKRTGYGVVEPNHLSAQRTAQIYAQLPAADSITLLENGQFVKYDYEKNEVNFTGDGEWLLVFNEIKLYESGKTYKDFAMIKDNYTHSEKDSYILGISHGQMYPRVFKTNINDIYTTNCVGGANTSATNTYAGIELEVGDKLIVDAATGYLVKGEGSGTDMVWKVVKVYTVPDGQVGVKLQRIQ